MKEERIIASLRRGKTEWLNRGLKKKTACGILHNFSDSIVKCETSPLSCLSDFSSLSAPLLHRGCGHIASRRR